MKLYQVSAFLNWTYAILFIDYLDFSLHLRLVRQLGHWKPKLRSIISRKNYLTVSHNLYQNFPRIFEHSSWHRRESTDPTARPTRQPDTTELPSTILTRWSTVHLWISTIYPVTILQRPTSTSQPLPTQLLISKFKWPTSTSTELGGSNPMSRTTLRQQLAPHLWRGGSLGACWMTHGRV